MKDDKNKSYFTDNHCILCIKQTIKSKSIYALGAGGRGFESRYPDKKGLIDYSVSPFCLYLTKY